ncbi:MAG: primosomal protein N', partial [Clostridia bacterium]
YNFSCPNCSVSMTYHAYGLPYRAKKLVCHYCGYTKDVPDECPDCKSKNIGYFGYGTQKLEDELTTLFPSAKAVRMDADTTAFKSSHAEILNAFAKHEYDILFGTQMVAKGLDFPNVSLVGVINADASLYMNDFRAGERTFSLFTQLVGRSGRSKKRGNAIIQTFSPDNEILRLAVKQDYEKFYQSEIVLRKAVVFPPFCDIAVFSFSSQTESDTNSAALVLTCEMREYYEKNEFTFPWTLLGPYNAGILKLKNRYRQSVIIKYRDSGESRMFLQNVYALLLKSAPTIIKIDLDINPSIV